MQPDLVRSRRNGTRKGGILRKGIIVLLLVLIVSAAILSGCTKPRPDGGNGGTDLGTDNLERFDSYDSLVAAFEKGRESDYYGYRGGLDMVFATGAVMESAADSGAVPNAGSGAKSTDYSTTNVQVEGVDEADIVKTDGKYIYVLGTDEDSYYYNTLAIVDAYPIDGSEVVSKTDLGDVSPTEIFLNEDKIVIFGTKYYEYDYGYGYKCFGCWYGGSFVVQVYDITDRANPEMEKEIEADGYYLTSRMIGDDIYFVVNSYPYWDVYPMPYMEEISMPVADGGDVETGDVDSEPVNETQDNDEPVSIIPTMKEDGVERPIAEPTDIGVIPYIEPTSFVTIYSLNVETLDLEEEVIAASGEAVYSSLDNLYLADSAYFYEEMDTNGSVLAEIGRPVVEMIAPSYWNYEEQTIVSKFKLDNGEVSFVASGAAPGHILNQFSMDEHEENFRIATTTGSRWDSRNSVNNVYIFNQGMEMIGSLEDLAPGESIYSVRFMGNKGYIVTFKKVDPLFVIDLGDPTNPTVLGKLKIPGYSDYLHPIDETHIIGLGKDTEASAYGDFAWYQGIKMAIFDVSDVSNPIEMHKTIIGDRGTESYALHDHKAFLFDKEKELLVIPVTLAEISEEQKSTPEEERWGPLYGEAVFQGAMVFNINLEDGISERGRITHVTEEEELKRGYYYDDSYSVKRALYIDDVLYTVSSGRIKANNLNTLEELKSFIIG